jgi:hypothetical protein
MIISGRLQTDAWEKHAVKRSKLMVDSVQFIGAVQPRQIPSRTIAGTRLKRDKPGQRGKQS